MGFKERKKMGTCLLNWDFNCDWGPWQVWKVCRLTEYIYDLSRIN